MGVSQGVAMDSLKLNPGPACSTLLCPAGGQPAAVFYPFGHPTPCALRLYPRVKTFVLRHSFHSMGRNVFVLRINLDTVLKLSSVAQEWPPVGRRVKGNLDETLITGLIVPENKYISDGRGEVEGWGSGRSMDPPTLGWSNGRTGVGRPQGEISILASKNRIRLVCGQPPGGR
jgi:hypothetical protein